MMRVEVVGSEHFASDPLLESLIVTDDGESRIFGLSMAKALLGFFFLVIPAHGTGNVVHVYQRDARVAR